MGKKGFHEASTTERCADGGHAHASPRAQAARRESPEERRWARGGHFHPSEPDVTRIGQESRAATTARRPPQANLRASLRDRRSPTNAPARTREQAEALSDADGGLQPPPRRARTPLLRQAAGHRGRGCAAFCAACGRAHVLLRRVRQDSWLLDGKAWHSQPCHRPPSVGPARPRHSSTGW